MPEPLHHLERSSSKEDAGRLLSLLPPIGPHLALEKQCPIRASDYQARRDRRNSRTRRASIVTNVSQREIEIGRTNGARQDAVAQVR